jgi:hypothetical protein
MVTDETHNEELEATELTHIRSLTSSSISSVIISSISMGLAHGYTVVICTIPNEIVGDDSFGKIIKL